MNKPTTKTERLPKEAYEEEPIHYCKQCLSLKVMRVAGIDDAVYCDECGSTDIGEANIEEWEALFEQRHGFRYLENNF
jgi:hypothetical protein